MMQHSAQWLILAASQDMHRVWGRFDHARPGFDSNHLVIILGSLALLAIVLFGWIRAARQSAKSFLNESPTRLFRELCAAHRLSLPSRRMLKRLASTRRLANPAMLFMQPEHFETTTLPAHLQPSANKIQKLRETLFEQSG
jgi:hypothetical protein